MTTTSPVARTATEEGRGLRVDVVRSLPALRVAAGVDAPRWVRATSALVPWQGGWVALQDDAAWLAALTANARDAVGIALPAEAAGRRVFEARLGNKHHKPDVEAAFLWQGTLYALGSGSAEGRDRWFALTPDGAVRGGRWEVGYAALSALSDFAGRWLNLEGACVVDGVVWLANRGNGGGRAGEGAVDALVAFDAAAFVAAMREDRPPPQPRGCVSIAPSFVGGVRRTLTDLAAGPGGVWTLWSAEDSPNAVDDGAVLGSWLGAPSASGWTLHPLLDATGAVLPIKAEGLAIVGMRAFLVTDADDVDAPSTWVSLALPGVAEPPPLDLAGRAVTTGVRR